MAKIGFFKEKLRLNKVKVKLLYDNDVAFSFYNTRVVLNDLKETKCHFLLNRAHIGQQCFMYRHGISIRPMMEPLKIALMQNGEQLTTA